MPHKTLVEMMLHETTTRSLQGVGWSCDGRVAVATRAGVCVVSLVASRSATSSGLMSTSWYDNQDDEKVVRWVLATGRRDLDVRQQWITTGTMPRCAVWSPCLGGRCVLAVVWVSGKVGLWREPRRGAKGLWDDLGTVMEAPGSQAWRFRDPRAVDAAWRPILDDGKALLATALSDGTVIVWAVSSGVEKRYSLESETSATAVAWAINDVVVGRSDGRVDVYADQSPPKRVARSADGRAVSQIIVNYDGTVVTVASSMVHINDDVLPRSKGARNPTSIAFVDGKLLICDADGLLEMWDLASLTQVDVPTCFDSVFSPWAVAVSPRCIAAVAIETVRYDIIKRTDPGTRLKVMSLVDLKKDLERRVGGDLETNDEWLWAKLDAARQKDDLLQDDLIKGQGKIPLSHHASDADNVVDAILRTQDLTSRSSDLLSVAHALAFNPKSRDTLRHELQRRHKKRPRPNDDDTEVCPICDADLEPIHRDRRSCLNGHALLISAHTGLLLDLTADRWSCPACGASIAESDHPNALCPFCAIRCAPS